MLYRWILILPGLFCAFGGSLFSVIAADSSTLPIVKNVELQPLVAHVRRVIEAAEYLGSPLSAADLRDMESVVRRIAEALGVTVRVG